MNEERFNKKREGRREGGREEGGRERGEETVKQTDAKSFFISVEVKAGEVYFTMILH